MILRSRISHIVMLVKRKKNSSVSHSFLRACASQSLLLLIRDTAASCKAILTPAPSGFFLKNLYMKTGALCCCKLPYSSAEQIFMKTAFVWRMSYSWKTYSHLQNARKIFTAFKSSSWISNIWRFFSASELEALSFQDSNSGWSYCCMNINGFDYSSRMSSLYMLKSTWPMASFPGSQSEFLLHSFFPHSACSGN